MGNNHLLVVDDDPDIRKLLKRYLVKFGYRVTCVENGRRALLAVADRKFNFIRFNVA